MKIISVLLLAFFLCIGVDITTYAESYYPKQISVVSTSTAVLKGGISVPVNITLSENSVSGFLVYDIGVSREIQTKNLTQFQILSSNKISYDEIVRGGFVYNVEIPNPIEESQEDKYRIYIKTHIPNDPESENLIISKPFSIEKTAAKTVYLQGASLVTNTNKVPLNSGPLIYKEPKHESHATSAAILLDFTSNVSLSIKGKFSFKKLRSSQFFYEIEPVSISVQKGRTVSVIQLPTFEYFPGVYQGELVFESIDGIQTPGKINFVYIVDGPSATVGKFSFVGEEAGKYKFDMDVFGRPVDQFSKDSVLKKTDPEIYETKFTFFDDANKVILTQTAPVDYGTSTYSLYVKSRKIEKIKKVHIETVYKGSIIFDTIKDINIPEIKKSSPAIWYIFILLAGIVLYVYIRKVWILIVFGIMALLSYTIHVSAAPWVMWDTVHSASQIRQRLIFNENYSSYSYNCNPEGTDILAKVETMSSGTVTQTYFGWADARYVVTSNDLTNALNQADANKVSLGGLTTQSSCTTATCGTDPAYVHIYTMDWMLVRNVKGPITIGPEIALFTGTSRATPTSAGSTSIQSILNRYNPTTCDYCSNISMVQTPHPDRTFGSQQFFYSSSSNITHYSLSPTIPLTPGFCPVDMCTNQAGYQTEIPIGHAWNLSATDFYTRYSCTPVIVDKCTNISGTQVSALFQAHSRDYFLALDDGKIYFLPSSAASPQMCTVDMCADTSTVEEDVPSGYVWNPAGTTPYQQYSCVLDTPETCSCSGRTYNCSDNGVQTSSTPNAPQCTLTASCSYAQPTTNQVTFNYTATNVLGSLINGGSQSFTIPAGSGTISDSRTLSNTGDGQTSVASCSYDYLSTNPQIISFAASKVVAQGSLCSFTWQTADMTSCTLGGESVGPGGTRSYSTTAGKNISKTLSCTTNEAIPQIINTTKVCLVKPNVVER